MFDIGWSEILVLAVLAIIVVGPKDLPVMLRNIGRYTAKMRSMAREFQDGISDMARETELNDLRDLKKNLSEVSPTQQVKKLVGEAIDPDEFDAMEKNQRALMEKAEAAADKFGAAPVASEPDVLAADAEPKDTDSTKGAVDKAEADGKTAV